MYLSWKLKSKQYTQNNQQIRIYTNVVEMEKLESLDFHISILDIETYY